MSQPRGAVPDTSHDASETARRFTGSNYRPSLVGDGSLYAKIRASDQWERVRRLTARLAWGNRLRRRAVSHDKVSCRQSKSSSNWHEDNVRDVLRNLLKNSVDALQKDALARTPNRKILAGMKRRTRPVAQVKSLSIRLFFRSFGDSRLSSSFHSSNVGFK